MSRTTLRALFAVIAVSAAMATARGQSSISIDESKIRAVLRNGSTVVVVPVSNFADRTLEAEVEAPLPFAFLHSERGSATRWIMR